MILIFLTTTDHNWNQGAILFIVLVLPLIAIGLWWLLYGERKPQHRLVLSNECVSAFTTQICVVCVYTVCIPVDAH